MLQEIVNKILLKISELEQYTDIQQSKGNELVDKVNDVASVRSQRDQSIQE